MALLQPLSSPDCGQVQNILNPEGPKAQPEASANGVSMSSLRTASLCPAHFQHQAALFCKLPELCLACSRQALSVPVTSPHYVLDLLMAP